MTLLALTLSASAQNRTVKGIVISGDDEEPVVGASVTVVGTQLGANTDLDGKFVIANVPQSAKSLRVSYVGMTSQEVPITTAKYELSSDLIPNSLTK